ncbi:transcriptional regulator [Streptomyces termitum]|uniref:Transcriptional regulator n=1 Tax=Streptomyces termitum TaxID=67368 RepID=A0A918WAW7_9ACTN|nr:transcriptional regulator [Streptomyces termitum]
MIGEVARRSGVSARMLRHYESLGLVRPSGRTGSGYREYGDEDIRRILHVESLRSLGLSLREIGRALDDPAFTPAGLVDELVRRTRERIAAETELLTRLSRLQAAGPARWEEALRVVALLQALGSKSTGARQRAALAAAEAVPVPAEALVEAVLDEPEPNVAGALRWALARSGDDVPALLAKGLASPVAAVRERAVRALAELPGPEAGARLRDALADPDAAVRGRAALALGARGAAGAVPVVVPILLDMIVAGRNDTDAADVLGALARQEDPAGPAPGTEGTTAPAPARETQTGPAPEGERADGAVPACEAPTGPVPARNRPDGSASAPEGADGGVPGDRVAAWIVARLADAAADAPARGRLTQALADVPGPLASRALRELTRDEDRAVALTATYLLTLRAAR